MDPQKVLNAKIGEQLVSYNSRDVLLYNVGIGATETCFVFEGDDDFSVIPTYSTCWSFKGDSEDVVTFGINQLDRFGGAEVNPMMILHGEQETHILKTLPLEGKFVNRSKNIGVYDKGSGAVIVSETLTSCRKTGDVYARNVISTFIRGAGGFGGDRGPSSKDEPLPTREPDVIHTESTSTSQALIYRLSGDYNPLHVDASMASMVGFERPILHGLCTYGYACRAVLLHFCNNNTKLFKSFKTRFSSTVLPGDTFITKMWKDGLTVRVHVEVEGGNRAVLSNCFFELNPTEVSPLEISNRPLLESQVIFDAMQNSIQNNPSLKSKVNAVILFSLTTNDGSIVDVTVDVKNSNAGVRYGKADSPDCTILMKDSDFFLMSTGKLNGQQAFMQGKMKIKGNMSVAQKISQIADPAKL
jgi:acyl dehydratase/putative sterol carrier protein